MGREDYLCCWVEPCSLIPDDGGGANLRDRLIQTSAPNLAGTGLEVESPIRPRADWLWRCSTVGLNGWQGCCAVWLPRYDEPGVGNRSPGALRDDCVRCSLQLPANQRRRKTCRQHDQSRYERPFNWHPESPLQMDSCPSRSSFCLDSRHKTSNPFTNITKLKSVEPLIPPT